MEFYLPEEHAESLIRISKSFGIDAQVIGRCESSNCQELHIYAKNEHISWLNES